MCKFINTQFLARFDLLHYRKPREDTMYSSCHWVHIIIEKTFHRMACAYSYCTHCKLRSADNGDLTVPHTRTVCFRNCSFRVAAPAVWDRLPPELKDSDISRDTFKAGLKTHYFSVPTCRKRPWEFFYLRGAIQIHFIHSFIHSFISSRQLCFISLFAGKSDLFGWWWLMVMCCWECVRFMSCKDGLTR